MFLLSNRNSWWGIVFSSMLMTSDTIPDVAEQQFLPADAMVTHINLPRCSSLFFSSSPAHAFLEAVKHFAHRCSLVEDQWGQQWRSSLLPVCTIERVALAKGLQLCLTNSVAENTSDCCGSLAVIRLHCWRHDTASVRRFVLQLWHDPHAISSISRCPSRGPFSGEAPKNAFWA